MPTQNSSETGAEGPRRLGSCIVGRLTVVVSLIFTLVMMTGVFGDLLTRNPMTLPSGNPPPQIEAE